jgi:hypothetical protein
MISFLFATETSKSAFPTEMHQLFTPSHVQVGEYFSLFIPTFLMCYHVLCKAFQFIIISFANVGPTAVVFLLFF